MARFTTIWLLGLLTVIGVSAEDFTKYNGHKVLRMFPASEQHVKLLQDLVAKYPELDIWREGQGDGTDIQIPPELLYGILQILAQANIRLRVLISDLGNFLNAQDYLAEPIPETQDISFTQYNRLSTINAWLDKLHTGDKIVVGSIGKSYEGRELKVIKIGQTVNNPGSSTPVIWIDGTIHAREWIAPAVAIYMIDKLVKDVQSGGALTKRFDWHILTVMNPDGYEFSHTTNRMWRKNLTPNAGSSCKGTDLNRNFDYKWGTVGISRNPCSNTFCGASALSEPEAKVVRDYVIGLKTAKVFLTLHSYGQLWLTPWGYTKELPSDYEEIVRVGKIANEALTKVHNVQYRLGSAANILYSSSGTSRDWAKGVPQIPYVFTLELRDRGNFGFLLPPRFIQPTSEEIWAAVQALANAVRL